MSLEFRTLKSQQLDLESKIRFYKSMSEKLCHEKKLIEKKMFKVCDHSWQRICEDGPYPEKYFICEHCNLDKRTENSLD